MFLPIYKFEFKNGLRKPSIYIFFAIYFAFMLFIALVSSGVIPIAQGDSLMNINSPYAITNLLIGTNDSVFGFLNSIILITIVGTAIQKDYQYNFHPLMFTKPITKASYFFGRFFGAFSLAVLVFLGPILGYLLGTLIGYNKPNVGSINIGNYIVPFLIFVLPNIFFQSIIFFSLTTFLRSTLPAYLFAIIIFVLQTISGSILANMDNKMMSAMLDLTGNKAFELVTEYWSPAQRNANMVKLEGAILYNRLLWFGIAVLVCILSYWKFSFTQFLTPLNLFKRKEESSKDIWIGHNHSLSNLPNVQQKFGFANDLKQLGYLTKTELKKIIQSPFYIIMTALGLAFVVILQSFSDQMYETPTYPVTYQIIEIIAGSFALFIMIFIIFYAGTMIWRDKEMKMDELIGTTPVSNSNLFTSKYLALMLSVSFIMLFAIATGIVLQLSQQFYDIGWKQYFVFFLTGIALFGVIALLSMSVQSIIPNKF